MQPLQTTEGIVLAGNIDDLKDLIIEKCGYEVYDFIKREENCEIADLRYQLDDMESDKDSEEIQRKEIAAELKEAKILIKTLRNELGLLRPDPVVIPIESLKKQIDLDDLDDEECIPF